MFTIKKKGKGGYIINDKGKKEYVHTRKLYNKSDFLKKEISCSFDAKLMIIIPIVFFVLNLIVLDTYSEIIKQSIFMSKNIPYIIVSAFVILWSIYLVIGYKKNPSRFVLLSGVICLVESIFFIIIGIQILYFLLGRKGISYIAIGIFIYILNFIFNIVLAYIFIKKGYSEKSLRINKFRILIIVLTFLIAIIVNINLHFKYYDINLLYPNMVRTNVLSYAFLTITLSHLIVLGTINIYKYIYMEK